MDFIGFSEEREVRRSLLLHPGRSVITIFIIIMVGAFMQSQSSLRRDDIGGSGG